MGGPRSSRELNALLVFYPKLLGTSNTSYNILKLSVFSKRSLFILACALSVCMADWWKFLNYASKTWPFWLYFPSLLNVLLLLRLSRHITPLFRLFQIVAFLKGGALAWTFCALPLTPLCAEYYWSCKLCSCAALAAAPHSWHPEHVEILWG